MMPATTLPPREVAREDHDRAVALFHAAMAEAGYPVRSFWHPVMGCHRLATADVPLAVRARARRLVYDAMGWPYEWVEVDEDPVDE